jgi:hypothetical protein
MKNKLATFVLVSTLINVVNYSDRNTPTTKTHEATLSQILLGHNSGQHSRGVEN